MENEIGKNLEKPQIFLKSITFNDNTRIDLERNSIIVFTGANNSGKSQTLKDIEIDLDKTKKNTMIVIKSLEYDYCGDIEEQTFFNQHFSINDKGYYQATEYSDMLFNRAVVCNCNFVFYPKRKLKGSSKVMLLPFYYALRQLRPKVEIKKHPLGGWKKA